MKLYCFLTLLLLAASFGTAQELVHVSDLSYQSNLEESLLKDYFENDQLDYLGVFMLIDKSVSDSDLFNSRNKFERIVSEIDMEKLGRKKPATRINQLYKKIHDSFLVVYEEQNHFNEIFETGEYNCVSATALYGMAFSNLNIPYEIRENPTHVYLVAYPSTDKVMVETTAPANAFNLYSDIFKKQFIKNLADNKIISQEQYEEESVNDLFDQYYFNDEIISLKELIGIQYMNDAIYMIERGEVKGAFQQLEKAYLFYPNKKCSYMLLMTGVRLLSEGDYAEDEDLVIFLSKMSRYGEYGISKDMVLGEFQRIKQALLIKNNDPDRFEEAFLYLKESIHDQDMIDEISYDYHFERGRLLYNKGDFSAALPYFEQAVSTRPSDQNGQGILVSTILQLARNEPDTENLIGLLEDKLDVFNTLTENNNFMSLLASSYLMEFSKNYQLQKPAIGEEWRSKFEMTYKGSKGLSVEYSLIGDAYSSAAVYYFRRGNKQKARQYIDYGLAISPNNFELLQRKSMIK